MAILKGLLYSSTKCHPNRGFSAQCFILSSPATKRPTKAPVRYFLSLNIHLRLNVVMHDRSKIISTYLNSSKYWKNTQYYKIYSHDFPNNYRNKQNENPIPRVLLFSLETKVHTKKISIIQVLISDYYSSKSLMTNWQKYIDVLTTSQAVHKR